MEMKTQTYYPSIIIKQTFYPIIQQTFYQTIKKVIVKQPDKEMKSPIAELVKDISKQHDIIFACQKGDINNHLTNINYISKLHNCFEKARQHLLKRYHEQYIYKHGKYIDESILHKDLQKNLLKSRIKRRKDSKEELKSCIKHFII